MRISLICADRGIPPDGTKGASVHVRSLITALAGAGHDVTLFAAARSERGARFPVPVVPLASSASVVADAAHVGAPDLVYERYSLGHGEGLVAARQLGVPFVLEVNAPLVLEASRHRPDTLRPRDASVERDLFREADLVVTVSEPLREDVAAVRGGDRPTVVIRNGCEPALYPSAAPVGRPGPATLAFLGHPKPWHGAEQLPRTVASLRARGVDVRLLIIGGGNGADAVRRTAVEAGVDDHVDVTGPLSATEAARSLISAAVAVAPYPPDPFFYFCPLKVVESMAAGVPVITTEQGDLPTILGGTGLLVPPGDEDAFAAAVEHLVRDPELRQRLGAAARRRALSSFTWDGVVEALMAAVSPLVTRSAPARARP